MNVTVFLLLLAVFLLMVYLFATKDNPFIPNILKVRDTTSKQDVINWWGWRGPMFTEDFAVTSTTADNDFGDIGVKNGAGVLSNLMNYTESDQRDTTRNNEPFVPSESDTFQLALDGFGKPVTEHLSDAAIKYANDKRQCHLESYGKCGNSNQATSERKYKNEFWNCSYRMKAPKGNDLGNFKQCTNNNLRSPNQLKCASLGRWDFDTCEPSDQVSHVCYDRNFKKCMANKGHTKN